MIEDLVAVVPAGGAGTRLWPLSRRSDPKFLHDLTGSGASLLQSTWQRLAPLASGTYVVTGTAHVGAVARQLPDLDLDDLLVEPSPRDSAAAIGLAAAVLAARRPDAVLGAFPADHVVADVAAFGECVRQAVQVARTGALVTVGITPTYAATGFGYVRGGASLSLDGAPDAVAVAEFVEKPDASTAQQYLADGGYRWNAGMFVVQAGTLLDLFDAYRPELGRGLRRLGAAWEGPHRQAVLDEVWPQFERVSVDYAVAEPAAAAGRVAMVPADLGWDDVGDFASLSGVLPRAEPGTVQSLGAGTVLSRDADGVVVAASGRLVAVLGVQDVVVVDTADALLVTTRARAQDVKALVDGLDGVGRADLR